MIRAAAKNYLRVAAVVDPAEYGELLTSLLAHDGCLDLRHRFEFARKAFAHVAAYDGAISTFLTEQDSRLVPDTYDLQVHDS
jgi:phosphoribosylaminoimidazolecarboxamide formyltransferase/IMP cyclohydrolase